MSQDIALHKNKAVGISTCGLSGHGFGTTILIHPETSALFMLNLGLTFSSSYLWVCWSLNAGILCRNHTTTAMTLQKYCSPSCDLPSRWESGAWSCFPPPPLLVLQLGNFISCQRVKLPLSWAAAWAASLWGLPVKFNRAISLSHGSDYGTWMFRYQRERMRLR